MAHVGEQMAQSGHLFAGDELHLHLLQLPAEARSLDLGFGELLLQLVNLCGGFGSGLHRNGPGEQWAVAKLTRDQFQHPVGISP